MTKEQLEKEAEEKGREWGNSVLPEREEDYTPYAPYYPYSKGYIAAAEPREKRIAELEKENAELKEAIQHINPCYEWNDDVHDCEFMHYAMKYGGKLTEATAIIKGLLESCFGPTSKTVNYEIKSRAEHFLKEE